MSKFGDEIILKNRFFIPFHFTQNDIKNPKLLP